VNNKAPGKLDPKTFDFNTVIKRVKIADTVKASIFLDTSPLERIQELDALLDAAEEPTGDRGIDDLNPTDELLAERNALVEQVNASELVFEFRPKKRPDQIRAAEAMKRDMIPEDDELTNSASICYVMAETCTNAGWTGKEWLQFRDEIGESMFLPLTMKAISANTGPGVTAPFSLRSSPTPTIDTI